jgi:hypothetical protein
VWKQRRYRISDSKFLTPEQHHFLAQQRDEWHSEFVLLTGQSPIPTFSVSFAQLNGASLVVKPSQFSPPIEQGSIGSLFIDANPCQQAIISDIRINTSSGQIIPNPTDSCPPFICQPPN